MVFITLTEAVKSNLKDTVRFTQQCWGLEQRNKHLKTLDDSFHKLASNPASGKTHNEIKAILGVAKYGLPLNVNQRHTHQRTACNAQRAMASFLSIIGNHHSRHHQQSTQGSS